MFIKSIKQNDLKVFLFYAISMFIFLFLALYFRFIIQDPSKNLLIRRIFLVLEFIFIGLYYYNNIVLRYKKPILVVSIISFLVFSIIDFAINQNIKSHFIPLAIECLFFIIVIVYFFYEKMKYIITVPIYKLSSFWISVAFLINFSGTFFLFVSSISMIDVPGFRDQYKIIYGSVTIIKNILLCFGIFVNKSNEGPQNNEVIQPNVDLETFNPFTTQK